MVLKLVVEQAKKRAPINPKSELREREAKAWLDLLIAAGNWDPDPRKGLLLKRSKGK